MAADLAMALVLPAIRCGNAQERKILLFLKKKKQKDFYSWCAAAGWS
jgi:hypothetical protein